MAISELDTAINEGRFEPLVAANRASLLRTCRRLVGSEAADDLCQETLLRAYAKRDSLQDSAAFLAWTRQIARRLAIDASRRRRLDSVALDEARQPASAQWSVAERVADADLIAGALEELNPQARRVVMLRGQGLSAREVGDAEGMSVAAVDTAFCRARSRLKALLGPEGLLGVGPIVTARRWLRSVVSAWRCTGDTSLGVLAVQVGIAVVTTVSLLSPAAPVPTRAVRVPAVHMSQVGPSSVLPAAIPQAPTPPAAVRAVRTMLPPRDGPRPTVAPPVQVRLTSDSSTVGATARTNLPGVPPQASVWQGCYTNLSNMLCDTIRALVGAK